VKNHAQLNTLADIYIIREPVTPELMHSTWQHRAPGGAGQQNQWTNYGDYLGASKKVCPIAR
jgi:hypothetical protein